MFLDSAASTLKGLDVLARLAGTATASSSTSSLLALSRWSSRASRLTVEVEATRLREVEAPGTGRRTRLALEVEAALVVDDPTTVVLVVVEAAVTRFLATTGREEAPPSSTSSALTLTASSSSSISAAALALVLLGARAVVDAVVVGFFSTLEAPPLDPPAAPAAPAGPFLLVTSPKAARFLVPRTPFPLALAVVEAPPPPAVDEAAEGLAPVVVVDLKEVEGL
ncbi:hypothetical protein BDY24DRAFT_283311 [Mrakia frigida]|uniref:uncharacterized protein n=1 Tax=Mrakia frigida TaxID=29902 RepID=UPI003FCC2013